MLVNYLLGYYKKVESIALNIASQRYWAFYTALIGFLIVIIFSFPNYDSLVQPHSINANAAIQKKIDHPFLQQSYAPKSHQAKLAFRLTVPIISKILGLDTFWCFILENILGLYFFYMIARIFSTMGQDKVVGIYASLFFSCIYIGKSFFNDVVSNFDGYAFLFLFLAMYFRNPLMILFFLLLANFTDERAIIASAIVYLWHVYKLNGAEFDFFSWTLKHSQVLVTLLSLPITLFLRYFLYKQYGLSIPIGSNADAGLDVIRINWPYFPLGLFCSIEFGWLIILGSVVILINQRKMIFVICLLAVISLMFGISTMVLDFSRSTAFVFPAILLGFQIVASVESTRRLRAFMFVVLASSFLFATIYVEGNTGCRWYSPFFPKIMKMI